MKERKQSPHLLSFLIVGCWGCDVILGLGYISTKLKKIFFTFFQSILLDVGSWGIGWDENL